MQLNSFDLEQWFVKYEFNTGNNLAASCARSTSTNELLKYGGDAAINAYLSLPLDYIPARGTDSLRTALADWFGAINGNQVLITTGASEAIWLVMNSILASGDEIVVEKPIYQSLFEVARAIGAKIVPWELKKGSRFHPDLEQLEKMITTRTKAVVVNHPHSPTGSVLSRDELKRLIKICEKFNVYLISDEVYGGIVYNSDDLVPPAADLSPLAVSIGDITKPFGLGGLRVGWLASQDERLLERCSTLRDYTTMCCSAPGEFLAALALNHRSEIMSQKIDAARGNLSLLASFINENNDVLEWVRPRGGFTAFPGYKFNLDSRSFCEGLITQEDVLLLPGFVFGAERHFRIGFGGDPAAFAAGLASLRKYITFLKENHS